MKAGAPPRWEQMRAWGKRYLLEILVAVLTLTIPAFAVVAWFAEPSWPKVLEYLGVGMGGVLLAIGAAVANRRAVAMEGAVESTEKGLRQERLKSAIEHLGHASDSVRMGGAYELFHLAKDTEDLRRTVLDILCAHIRQTTGETGYRAKHESKPSEEIQSLLTLLFVQECELFENLNVDL